MIITQPVYYPLYTNKDKFIILVTGGRGSGKSFNVGAFIERLTFEVGHNILFTRYTMSSAKDSVIPEFREKVELDGTSDYFNITNTDAVNLRSGSKVMFRGIKTSSGNQTAKLKSLQGLTTFVVDEGEEWMSATEFETLVLSIRQKGIQNRVIIIMNPTDENHFVYQKYIKNTHKLVDYDGAKVQISTHPNVLHIHTSYLDNIDNLDEEFLNIAKRMREENKKKYDHLFMGRWADVSEGAIFKDYEVVDEFPSGIEKIGIGLDFGYSNDPTAAAMCGVIGNNLFIKELLYLKGLSSSDIAKRLRRYNGLKVIADSADPRLIDEIKAYGVNIYPVKKGAGSIEAGINKMLDMKMYVTRDSVNLLEELRRFTWDVDKDGNKLNKPIDDYDHCVDSVRYWVLSEVLGHKRNTIDATNVFF